MGELVYQPAILAPGPPRGRFITFSLREGVDPTGVLRAVTAAPHDEKTIVGFGAPVIEPLGVRVEGLRPFPRDLPLFPSTQEALWLFLAHASESAMFDAGRRFSTTVRDAFTVVEDIATFKYKEGRDLTGFEDGTENPKGKAALQAAIIRGRGKGLDGGSFVAVERFVHDLAAFDAMSTAAQNAVIGRRRKDNVELADAPPSAHVKRTAQESFDPPAFIVRKSMPWSGAGEHGLYFVAFGESLDRFERQLRRMAGQTDGVVDALIAFSKAVTGAYYFCPPLKDGKLDLRALGVK
jgi:putative iron-dependent peroxidase